MKVDKKLVISMVVIITFNFAAFYAFYNLYHLVSSHGEWYINHGIKVPKPEEELNVYRVVGPQGDGEIYTICEYDEENFHKLLAMGIWNTVNSQLDIDFINKHIDSMKKWMDAGGKSGEEIFLKYPIPIKDGYRFYFLPKDQGGYFLLIVNTDDRKLYGLELTN